MRRVSADANWRIGALAAFRSLAQESYNMRKVSLGGGATIHADSVVAGDIGGDPDARWKRRRTVYQLRHWSGQGVAPVYEGFDVNEDGSYTCGSVT